MPKTSVLKRPVMKILFWKYDYIAGDIHYINVNAWRRALWKKKLFSEIALILSTETNILPLYNLKKMSEMMRLV